MKDETDDAKTRQNKVRLKRTIRVATTATTTDAAMAMANEVGFII